MTSDSLIGHSQFYSKSLFYDIAFSFKNVPQENQTILDVFRKHSGREANSFLDIAAGPATNAIEMSKRGLTSFAIDFSSEMVQYGLQRAAIEKAKIQYIQADMKRFKISHKVDLAAIFMDSTSYLITNDDVINHLNCVADALNQNGIYILEMSHPRDVFSVGKSSSTEWTEQKDDIKVSVQWGGPLDVFDPIRQTTNVTAKIKYETASETGEILDRSDQRCFTFLEFDALVKAAGCFELIEVLGSLKPGIPFSNEKASWRMIPILRKI